MGSYIIKEGDTLANIAAEFGTTVEDIAAANNIQNVNLIYAGDELNINVPQAAPVPQPVTTNDVVDETDLSEFTEPVVEQAAPAVEPAVAAPVNGFCAEPVYLSPDAKEGLIIGVAGEMRVNP